MAEDHTLAMFMDFENLALGLRDRPRQRFEINKILDRLVEKGKVIVKKAYADWGQYQDYK
ncbi:MAG TPA: NYN domain-containing protein, partial [Acidobacteriota bacterium]|nr:NYN domain-containing protein [Acidobacteriota bacterium]